MVAELKLANGKHAAQKTSPASPAADGAKAAVHRKLKAREWGESSLLRTSFFFFFSKGSPLPPRKHVAGGKEGPGSLDGHSRCTG